MVNALDRRLSALEDTHTGKRFGIVAPREVLAAKVRRVADYFSADPGRVPVTAFETVVKDWMDSNFDGKTLIDGFRHAIKNSQRKGRT